jgi:predicted protein tyrosine phosphatase
MKLPRITICGAEQLRSLKHSDFTHVVSIWGAHAPRIVITRMEAMFPAAKLHVTFFDDVLEGTTETGAPGSEHVRDILDFGSWLTSGDSLLVQCLMGISRSSACAFAIACQHAGVGCEQEVLKRLVKKHPGIRPNPRIAQIADDLLGRNGAMANAVDAYLKSVVVKR